MNRPELRKGAGIPELWIRLFTGGDRAFFGNGKTRGGAMLRRRVRRLSAQRAMLLQPGIQSQAAGVQRTEMDSDREGMMCGGTLSF